MKITINTIERIKFNAGISIVKNKTNDDSASSLIPCTR